MHHERTLQTLEVHDIFGASRMRTVVQIALLAASAFAHGPSCLHHGAHAHGNYVPKSKGQPSAAEVSVAAGTATLPSASGAGSERGYNMERIRKTADSLLTGGSPVEYAATFFPLSAVQLLPGGRGYALQNLTRTWLYTLNPDTLLYSFRATANLSTNGAVAPAGWEDPTSNLRGHITGGHFLSGAAMLVNATGDSTLAGVLQYMLGELAKCQAANEAGYGAGYLMAYPPTQFDILESGGCQGDTSKCWAPYYTVHKEMRGLYDVYTMLPAGVHPSAPTASQTAASIAAGMAGYFARRMRNFIAANTISAWWPLMVTEFGGMNEISAVWAGAFAALAAAGAPGANFTAAAQDAAFLASIFIKPALVGPMAIGADVLTGNHANTNIPIMIGAGAMYEASGVPVWGDVMLGFLDAVTDGHTFVTGGTSTGEWWSSNPHWLGDGLDVNGVESCTTYNEMKAARKAISWSLQPRWLEFWERMHATIYGTAHPTLPGRVIYLHPTRGANGAPGGSKAHTYWGYSDPSQSMWCCVGSAMETHSKHGESLFMQQGGTVNPVVLVTAYDAATLTSSGITVTQVPTWSATALSVSVSVSATAGAGPFAVAARIPVWGATGATATMNGTPLQPTADGGWFNATFLDGTSPATLSLTFPFQVLLEHLDDERPQFAGSFALTAGPWALGAITRVDDVIVSAQQPVAGTQPSWVRPLSAAERSASISLAAIGPFPGGLPVYIRHDNATAVWAAVLSIPSRFPPNASVTPTYTPQQQQGFLTAGSDLYSGVMTIAEAEALCTANFSGTCLGFTFESNTSSPSAPLNIYLKSAVNFEAAAGWYTYVSSRYSNAMGGDEDGPDSTWIRDAPLQPGAGAGAISVRSMNRPGEYISCTAAGSQCAIAHDTGANSAAFNASATWIVHSPGLSGGAGTMSLESAAVPGAYLSWYGAQPDVNTPAPLSLLPNKPGNSAYAAASTFDASGAPTWVPPVLTYVASTSDGSVTGSRDFLLYPVADMPTEWFTLYLDVQQPKA